ncbi:hypothetical protein ACIQGZ_13615 [Streptomyces sp. NPDC092296]|uniref:hypothetical protein n=1 Tax=Streptomyces sp. NPDC092296 TaxID=3366012 RepID=UPI00382F69D4
MPAVRLARRRVAQLSAMTLLTAAFAAQFVGVLLPSLPTLVAATAVCLGLDLYLQERQPGMVAALGRMRVDATVTQLLRDMLLMLGLLRLDGDRGLDDRLPLVAGLLVFYLLHFLCQGVAVSVRRTRRLPVVTRNIDTTALRLSAAPPQLLIRQAGRRLLRFSVPATAGLLATAVTDDVVWGVAGLGAAVLLTVLGMVYLGSWLLRRRRPVTEDQALEWLDAWLAAYQPTVGMYFSGGTSSAYQANMWLRTLSELDGKPIIVLRERFMVQKIDSTDIPIVCIPKVAHLMRLEHSSLRLLLHPANSGKTSQILRIPSIKHAFINHGESDKLSSCNPYAKAYDEVWVAGPAARERYRMADIGVEDKDVVEVGRPQLAPITPYAGPPRDRLTTVLYAPTWEGWDGQPGNTSVIEAGENVVRALLADPEVRLLYKPHPMTGSVDPRAKSADDRIRAMIFEAGRRRTGARPSAEALAELARRAKDLDRLASTTFRKSADELERNLRQGVPAPGRAATLAAATLAWERAYWAALPDWEHQVITGSRPALFTCFNQADLLISDVSSVVSDWLTSEKPYAVVNTSGLTEAAFRTDFPTVSAATILTADARGVPGLLEAVRHPEKDVFVAARAELKEQLLGPSDPPSIVRFNAAALALAGEAEARRSRWAARQSAVPMPAQRTTAATGLDAEEEAEAAETEAALAVTAELAER